MKVLVTGGTGFIGRALCARLLQDGWNVVVLTRHDAPGRPSPTPPVPATAILRWDPGKGLPGEAQDTLADLTGVVHLAGEPVAARRWSTGQKARIRDSRVHGTRALIAGLRQFQVRPRVFVSASAIGYYGDRGDEELHEDAPPGSDFLSQVCVAWEKEAREAESLGAATVQLRIGLVLGAGGGALQRMLLPFRLGLGGPFGLGRHWMSWIHREDVVGLIRYALTDNPGIHGPVNAVSPQPVRNGEFAQTLGRALNRPAVLPLPPPLLRLALGEMSQLLLDSQRVLPTAAQRAGYGFAFPTLESALKASLRPVD